MTFELSDMGGGVSNVEDENYSDTDSDHNEAENSFSATQRTPEEPDK